MGCGVSKNSIAVQASVSKISPESKPTKPVEEKTQKKDEEVKIETTPSPPPQNEEVKAQPEVTVIPSGRVFWSFANR